MLRSLRNQVLLSQIVPLLIVIPLMGVALIYTLERRYFLPSFERDLTGDALLLVKITQEKPDIWQDPQKAQVFVEQFNPGAGKGLMLLGPDGRWLLDRFGGFCMNALRRVRPAVGAGDAS